MIVVQIEFSLSSVSTYESIILKIDIDSCVIREIIFQYQNGVI